MKVYINGMMCQHCAARVKKALEEAGCKAEIDLENKCAHVTECTADEAALRAAVEKAGYEFVSVARD